MANEPNMKVTYTSDSSKFVAGTRQAKNAVRDFQKTTGTALADIGEAFGVNTGKVNQLSNAIQGMGVKMTKSGSDSVRALGNVLLSLDKVKLGIAGLGIGAAIASFKALNETAEAFKKTVQGANLEMMTAAYVDTYRRAFFDMNSSQGQAFANFQSGLKKAWAEARSIFTSVLVNPGQTAQSLQSVFGAAMPGGIGIPVAVTGVKDAINQVRSISDQMQIANDKATRAEEIQSRLNELRLEQLAFDREDADVNNRISELKNKVWDKSNSEVERATALREVQDLIRQRYTQQYDIQSEIADLMEEQNGLTNSSYAELEAANQQRIKANSLVGQMNGELKSLLRQQNSLNGAAGAGAKAESDAAAAAKELARVSATVADLSSRRAERVSAVADIEARIADLRKQAADSSATEADRAAAVAEAQMLVRTELAAQYSQETQLADAMARVNELSTATPDAIDKANRQRVLAISLMAEQQRQLRELSSIQGESIEFSESEADIEQKIIELRGIAMDLASSEETRAEAIATAHELIRQKYAQQYSLEMSLAASLEDRARLNGNDADLLEEANQHREKALGLSSQMASAIQELIVFQQELTKKVNETTEAYGSMAAAKVRPEMVDLTTSGSLALPGATTTPNTTLAGDLGKVQEVKRAIIDIRSELTNLAAEGASAIGSLIGDLINGENAWSNFGNAALEALGDMAVAVGKTIMQEGIAVEAAKLALTTMSGVGAIAAGAALVAIGSALKTSLKNAAAGNYSASSSVASSSYRGSSMTGGASYEQREIRVTGALVASGNQLIAVINNEDNRKSHTT